VICGVCNKMTPFVWQNAFKCFLFWFKKIYFVSLESSFLDAVFRQWRTGPNICDELNDATSNPEKSTTSKIVRCSHSLFETKKLSTLDSMVICMRCIICRLRDDLDGSKFSKCKNVKLWKDIPHFWKKDNFVLETKAGHKNNTYLCYSISIQILPYKCRLWDNFA
jgi:hypothetical protein